jgi:serralysin
MGKTINGTNGNDTLKQGNLVEVRIFGRDGNDRIALTRDDDLGGNNFVDAGNGNDTVANVFEGGNRIRLGNGNDTYVGGGFDFNFADRVDGGAGRDRFFVGTNISTYNGGDGNDTFISVGHKNIFSGGAGIDTISYEIRHEDSVVGDQGVTISLGENGALTGSNSLEQLLSIENATGSLNADIIAGSDGRNVLAGLAGDDEIHGLRGNDNLVGGLGKDILFGGSGRDHFIFGAKKDSGIGLADEIRDFSRADGDRIDLSAIDADSVKDGNQAFHFLGEAAFSGKRGQVRFEDGVVLVDLNGDRQIDMVIGVDNTISMLSSDFIL